MAPAAAATAGLTAAHALLSRLVRLSEAMLLQLRGKPAQAGTGAAAPASPPPAPVSGAAAAGAAADTAAAAVSLPTLPVVVEPPLPGHAPAVSAAMITPSSHPLPPVPPTPTGVHYQPVSPRSMAGERRGAEHSARAVSAVTAALQWAADGVGLAGTTVAAASTAQLTAYISALATAKRRLAARQPARAGSGSGSGSGSADGESHPDVADTESLLRPSKRLVQRAIVHLQRGMHAHLAPTTSSENINVANRGARPSTTPAPLPPFVPAGAPRSVASVVAEFAAAKKAAGLLAPFPPSSEAAALLQSLKRQPAASLAALPTLGPVVARAVADRSASMQQPLKGRPVEVHRPATSSHPGAAAWK